MRRKGGLKPKQAAKRGPKPKQATQDRYFKIAKLVYQAQGAEYPKGAAIKLAMEAFKVSRKTAFKAVKAAEATHKEELERAKAEYDFDSYPLPDAPPGLTLFWTEQRWLWQKLNQAFRKKETSRRPKIVIDVRPPPIVIPCPKCGALGRRKEARKVFCTGCDSELDQSYWPRRK
jgi:hypothetical protein